MSDDEVREDAQRIAKAFQDYTEGAIDWDEFRRRLGLSDSHMHVQDYAESVPTNDSGFIIRRPDGSTIFVTVDVALPPRM